MICRSFLDPESRQDLIELTLEVAERLETADPRVLQAPLQAALVAFLLFPGQQ
jgi:hypothetical protein